MADTKFKRGNNGRPKGAINKTTAAVKETVLRVFNELQGDPVHNLLSWAKGNPTEFYKIAAKLIPTDIKAEVNTTDGSGIKVIFGKQKQ